jgi:hypothetical protein
MTPCPARSISSNPVTAPLSIAACSTARICPDVSNSVMARDPPIQFCLFFVRFAQILSATHKIAAPICLNLPQQMDSRQVK